MIFWWNNVDFIVVLLRISNYAEDKGSVFMGRIGKLYKGFGKRRIIK